MSYPPHYPYSGPQTQQPYGYDPYAAYNPSGDALAPARRASLFMFIIGGVLTLCSFGCTGIGAMAPWQEVFDKSPEIAARVPELTPDLMRGIFIGFGVTGIVISLGLVLLAYFVRRGSGAVIITSIILGGIAVIGLIVVTLSGIVQGATSGQPQVLFGACLYLVPLGLFGLMLFFLIQAARAMPRVAQAKSQQADMMSYHQQQQVAYQQAMQQYQQQQQMQPQMPPPPSSPNDSDNAPTA